MKIFLNLPLALLWNNQLSCLSLYHHSESAVFTLNTSGISSSSALILSVSEESPYTSFCYSVSFLSSYALFFVILESTPIVILDSFCHSRESGNPAFFVSFCHSLNHLSGIHSICHPRNPLSRIKVTCHPQKLLNCHPRKTLHFHPRNPLSGIQVTCHPQLDWGSSVYFLFLCYYQPE